MWMKISGKIRAVAVGNFVYAQEFLVGENFWEKTGQWRQEKSYMPGNLLSVRVSGENPGSGDRNFCICPNSWFLVYGLYE